MRTSEANEGGRRRPLTLMTLFGTRPEVIKLFPVIDALERVPDLRNVIVSTSQHREMIDGLMQSFGIRLDADLNIIQPDQTLAEISVRALSGLDPLLEQHRPDLLLVQGDTTTAFIGALAAFYRRVQVGHVEAGLRSFDKHHPFPEEVNRRLISVAADLHFAPTEAAGKNLEKSQVPTESVFVTGNTVTDALRHVARGKASPLADRLPTGALAGKRLVLVTAHRRENFGAPLEELCHGLRDVVRTHPDIVVVYPVHLNPNVRKPVFRLLEGEPRVHLLDPLTYETFVDAMASAHLIVTDSGGVQEEAPSLGKPVLVFRETTERQEGVHAGAVRLVGSTRSGVVRAANELLEGGPAYDRMTRCTDLYGDGTAGQRIADCILYHFDRGPRPVDFKTNVEPSTTARSQES